MGVEGARLTASATHTADALATALVPLAGAVTARKMFGGYGVFADGVMFALVDSQGAAFLHLGADADAEFPERHGRMPYGRIPDEVMADGAILLAWARRALGAAVAAKRR